MAERYPAPSFGGSERELIDHINAIAQPLHDANDLTPLIDHIGDAKYVLLGEASHGTSEYYLWRARLSLRLIEEKGFSFVAVEGDWPDCYEINRYIKGYNGAGGSAKEVLTAFKRWPTWMWANWEVAAFTEWLRRYNIAHGAQAGFYGLDVYSLWESMEAVTEYLTDRDPDALSAAREAYRCFEPFGESEQAYALSTRMVPENCEDEVVDLLREMRRGEPQYAEDREAAFGAEQNALVMVDAERYYRAMVRSDSNSWNVRDIHMADTLDRLTDFHGPDARAIVWAHNTHVGDARATDMTRAGMVNIGELARQRHAGDGVALVGFGSFQGSVIAGDMWGAPMERMTVPAGQDGSWEDILHSATRDNKLLLLDAVRDIDAFLIPRGHRAIGVVYDPALEHYGNYVPTVLPSRYDAFLYVDQTHALHPMHLHPEGNRVPETYPWGL